MKTQSDTIYHCVSCGRVVHADLEGAPPQCCGHAMAVAVPETMTESAVPGKKVGENTETPLEDKGSKKPR